MSSDIDPAEQPFEYYIEHLLEDRSLTDRRERSYRRTVSNFQAFLEDRSHSSTNDIDISDVRGFAKHLTEDCDLALSTVQTRLTSINKLYKDLNAMGVVNENPVQLVLNEIDFDTGRTQKRDITVAEMGSFLKRRCKHPIFLAVLTTLAKTGMRVGELVNLDIQDVYIDHPQVEEEYPALRPELEERSHDSIYITPEISEGDRYRGEIRQAGNKRERETLIPIDSELKQILINYLLVRPPTSVVKKPFFVGIGGCTNRLDQRLTKRTVHQQLAWRAEKEGWREDGYDSLNVSPHYFRHFFTTHANREMDKMTVKYLRGDKGDDVMEIYIHNWGNRVRKEYLANIYTLF